MNSSSLISSEIRVNHSLKKKEWLTIILILLGFVGSAVLLQQLGYAEFYFAIPISLLLGLGMLYKPRVWTSLYVLAIGPYLVTGGEGVSALEVVLAAGLNGGLLVWLLGYKFVGNKRYIVGLSEYLFLAFHLLSLLNIGIAYLNEVPMFDWFRVYLRLSLVFYFIPLRIYFGDKEGMLHILKLFIFVVLAIVAFHFYTYYTYVTKIEMAYQIGKGVRINLGFLSTIPVVLAGLFYTLKGKINKTIVFSLLALVLAALVTTFARTYWLTALLGMGFLFLYLNMKEKLSTIAILLIFMAGSLITLEIVLGDIFEIAIKALSERINSSSKGASDVSLKMRLLEYDEAFKQIAYYPLGGKGFASKIDFYIPYVLEYWNTHNIHNSFIYTMFKTGIPMMLLYVSAFVMMMYRSYRSIRLNTEKKFRYLSIGIFSGFLTIFLASFLANNFFERDSIILISFLIYFSSVLYYRPNSADPLK